MIVTASEVFDFLERHDAFVIERSEIGSSTFNILRAGLCTIVMRLREGDSREALELSESIRAHLMEWLTAPVIFDGGIVEVVRSLGTPEAIEGRWGRDIRSFHELSVEAAAELALEVNHLRLEVGGHIQRLRAERKHFRIYCHRRARAHFESLFSPLEEPALTDACFLHSVRDYRDAPPFEVLLKVGPLRSRGWGAVPDAILTAPRFTTLLQFVWSGCADEPDFGYEPIAAPAGTRDAVGGRQIGDGISWATSVRRLGDAPGASPQADVEADEFALLQTGSESPDRRRATLVQIDGEHGILYPPHSQVLSFDPATAVLEPLARRLPGETLVEGLYVVRPLLLDVDLGEQRAELGHYSRVWKVRLVEEYGRAPDNLIARLHAAGLRLQRLDTAIENWCRPPTTVIHAPQQKRHFEILVSVLQLETETASVLGGRHVTWWLRAWDEVGRSRGEASQAGLHSQDIIEEQLLTILRCHLPELRAQAVANDEFSFSIPPGEQLEGVVQFEKVRMVEEGFLVPDSEMKYVRPLGAIEQWRV